MAAPFRLGPKSFTLAEIAKHNSKDDAWIVVNNKVYDITGFVQAHHGWELGGGVSTLLSILRNLGADCSQEFNEIHSPTAKQQLKEYYIGVLRLPDESA